MEGQLSPKRLKRIFTIPLFPKRITNAKPEMKVGVIIGMVNSTIHRGFPIMRSFTISRESGIAITRVSATVAIPNIKVFPVTFRRYWRRPSGSAEGIAERENTGLIRRYEIGTNKNRNRKTMQRV